MLKQAEKKPTNKFPCLKCVLCGFSGCFATAANLSGCKRYGGRYKNTLNGNATGTETCVPKALTLHSTINAGTQHFTRYVVVVVVGIVLTTAIMQC